MKRAFLKLVACSAIAVSSFAVTIPPLQAQADLTPEQRRPYVRMAAASDQFEIQSSQIALQRSRRPQVRSFAQMLNRHHRQTTRQLMRASQAAGMRAVPATLMPMQANMIRELNRARPRDFDRLFIDQQITAHEMALRLHQNYAADGDTPALRRTAQAAVPIIQQHLDEARRLDR